jgi:hypothetical protein
MTAKDEVPLAATGAMENYFGWLQKTMSASPWGNADLNKKLLQCTTQNISAGFEFMQKLSQAKNLQDVVRLQTEFAQMQFGSCNEWAKNLSAAWSTSYCG